MTNILLTKRDADLIASATSFTGSIVRITRYSGRGFEIAALRYFGDYLSAEAPRSHRNADVNALRLTLCKMVEMYPDREDEFLVLKSTVELYQDMRMGAILHGYSKTYNSMSGGVGSWALAAHEQIVNALFHLHHHNSTVAVISTADLQSILRAYDKQASQVVTQPASVRKSVRESVAQELMENSTTSTQRRQAAQDASGKCFMCSSPKPRQVTCIVCGYTPKGVK